MKLYGTVHLQDELAGQFLCPESKSITPDSFISSIHHFAETAAKMLSSNTYSHTYIMIIFGINNLSEINHCYGSAAGHGLICHIQKIIKSYIHEPNLYCHFNVDNFAIFMENCKDIDLALLVIQLTEEIADFNRGYNIKLSFGICKANHSDSSISSLLSRALYAKRSVKIDAYQLLVDYNEIKKA